MEVQSPVQDFGDEPDSFYKIKKEAVMKFDLAPVRQLLQAYRLPSRHCLDEDLDVLFPEGTSLPENSDKVDKIPSLGDFDRIWTRLGKPLDAPPPVVSSPSSDARESQSSRPNTPGTTATDESNVDEIIPLDVKSVRWKDEEEGTGPDHDAVKSEIRAAKKKKKKRDHLIEPSGRSSDSKSKKFNPVKRTPIDIRFALRPAWVTPPPPVPLSHTSSPPLDSFLHVDRTVIRPLHNLTWEEKAARLKKKLAARYQADYESIHAFDLAGAGPRQQQKQQQQQQQQQPQQQYDNQSDGGIHVFVDCSNIAIGFYDNIKLARGIGRHEHVRKPPLSYSALAFIMERGRDIARRVLVGSTKPPHSAGAPYHQQQQKLPSYLVEAERCGYELCILERVMKRKDAADKLGRRHDGSGHGYATSLSASDHETAAAAATPRWVMAEQGVDELLQYKMLESLVDRREGGGGRRRGPATIVLASGDAAEAEYSGGFLQNVVRALELGWRVELVSWGSSLAGAYRERGFRERWGESFVVVRLDEFAEELLAGGVADGSG